MRIPKYDVLLPILFVGVVFPAVAGGWWRFFSGHANQLMNPMVHSETAVPANFLLNSVHPIQHRSAVATGSHHIALTKPDSMPVVSEPSVDRSLEILGGSPASDTPVTE